MKPDTEKRITRYGEVYYLNTITGTRRRRWWTKARVPGTVRKSRMTGGPGYRGDRTYEGAGQR
jgi:hypothetical protein